MIYVLYHGYDLDGRCAAAIVRRARGEVKLQAAYHAYQLEPYVIATAKSAEAVYVLDWSPQDISLLGELNANVLWIDHHVVAIQNYEAWSRASGRQVGGLRGEDAACVLTWKFMYPDVPPPRGVVEIAAADVSKATSEMMDFVKGISCCPTYPLDHGNETTWERCLSGDAGWYEERCREGRAVRDYEKYNPKQRRTTQFRRRAELMCLRRIVEITAPGQGSLVATDVPLIAIDSTMMLRHTDQRYVLGYKLTVTGPGSADIVSALRQLYPTSVGGGHSSRATIVMEQLPNIDFNVPPPTVAAALPEF